MTANSKSDKIEENIPFIHPDCGRKSSSVAAEKSSNKSIKMEQKHFLFDIIVVRLDIPNMTIEQTSKLLVNGTFNGKNFKIPSSRINVVDFTTESILEVVASPIELKQQLSVNPLTLKVTDPKKVLGYGMLKWPTKFLSELEQNPGEITGLFEIELMKCDGIRTGTMLINVRLQMKCEEYEEDNTPDGRCRNANKEIDPNDVLFVVGEEDRKNCCCSQIGIIPASDSDQDLQPKCLDLSNYRAINSQNVNNTNILAAQDPCCEKVEAIKKQYQKILEALKSKNKQSTHKKTSDKKGDLIYALPSETCLKVNVFPSCSDLCRSPELFPPVNRAFAAKDVKQIAHTGSVPELVENKPQSLRHCPFCKENMEYLPKLAACPNCCYKPVPCFEEMPYDDSKNADQIIKEYHENLQKTDNSAEDACAKQSSKSRCTCKYGSKKPCANCRIRKLCKDIFQPPLPTTNGNDICEQKSSVVNCVSSLDNRPFLTKIFSELKDLYDIEEPKKKEFELDERCEKHLNPSSGHVRRSPKEKDNKRNIQTVQNAESNEKIKPEVVRKRKKCSAKAASEKAVKSKWYDYQFARKVFTYKCGHKACTNMKNIAEYKNVPPNMGWLWNVHNPGKWKPGSIRKPIKELMRYFLKDFPADTLLVSPYSYRRKSKPISDPSYNTILQKPTLHIHKKNGEYIITMRPLKPIEVLKDSADPYENMKLIQFRIVKNPQLEMARSLKKCLKSMGFKKCVCHRPIIYCYCRSFVDKKRLEYQCNKECCRRQIESCCDTLVLTDTSESEDEFDFAVTPPVGVIKPEKLKKINLVNVSTQYNELDWNPMPLFPRPPNKYMQMYQCAVRERKPHANLGRSDNSETKDASNILRKDSCLKKPFGNLTATAGKRQIAGRDFAGARGGGGGGGDSIMMGKKTIKGSSGHTDSKGKYGSSGPTDSKGKYGSSGPTDSKVKYGGRGDSMSNKMSEKAENALKKKVDMLKYVQKSNKKMAKLTRKEVALKRKEKMNLLNGANPPLLCMVDRLGKPADPCASGFAGGDERVC